MLMWSLHSFTCKTCDLLNMILVHLYGYTSKSENDYLFDTLEIRLTHCLSKFPN